jgi:predicted nucleic acid-binding protein
MIIIDASVALAWCFADEGGELADAVLSRVVGEGAAAPAHWPLEVANGLRSAERRGRLTAEETVRATQLLNGLDVEVVAAELTTATWTVLDGAREHGLTAYDAAYLDLARFRGLALATIDEPLADAATRAGIGVVGVSEPTVEAAADDSHASGDA